MKRLATTLMAFVSLIGVLQPRGAAAVEIEPVYSLQFLGGQYFFTGGHSKLAGNASALVAPGIRLNERWELYPSVLSSFRGTKDVVDLVGAGTVFQQQMDHRVGLKGAYSPEGSKWRIKPSASHGIQLLKETTDESWGKGLFDYQKTQIGLAGEYVYRKPFSVRASLDYSITRFTNYTSLESQAALDFNGKALARELVGDRVLDSNAQLLTLGGGIPVRKFLAEASYALLYARYPNQPLVDAQGALTSEKRADLTQSVDASLKFPWLIAPKLKAILSLGMGFVYSDSNQNSFDAFQAKFIGGHYDYRENRRSLGAKVIAGDDDWPTALGLTLTMTERDYLSRPIQDGTGLYQSDTLSTRNLMISATASRPLAPRFKAVATLQHGLSRSNQGFTQFYAYDYQTTNYLLGVSYDY